MDTDIRGPSSDYAEALHFVFSNPRPTISHTRQAEVWPHVGKGKGCRKHPSSSEDKKVLDMGEDDDSIKTCH